MALVTLACAGWFFLFKQPNAQALRLNFLLHFGKRWEIVAQLKIFFSPKHSCSVYTSLSILKSSLLFIKNSFLDTDDSVLSFVSMCQWGCVVQSHFLTFSFCCIFLLRLLSEDGIFKYKDISCTPLWWVYSKCRWVFKYTKTTNAYFYFYSYTIVTFGFVCLF